MFATDKIGETMTVAMTPRRRQGLVRRGAARPVGRGARARRRLALQLLPRLLPRRRRRRPAGTTSCSRTSRMPHVLWRAVRARTSSSTREFEDHEKAHGRGDRRQGARRWSSRRQDDKYAVLARSRTDTPGTLTPRRSTRRSSPTSSTTSTTWREPAQEQAHQPRASSCCSSSACCSCSPTG